MAYYEFPGLRQKLIQNPHPLCRLEECVSDGKPVSHERIISNLMKNYVGKDIVAIYSTGSRSLKPNSFTNALFMRGILERVNFSDLTFKGPVGKTGQGIEYQGHTWIVSIDQLIDVISPSDYNADSNPCNFSYSMKEFEFSTMFDDRITIGRIQDYDPVGAYLKLTQQVPQIVRELKVGPTTPIRLKNIAEIPVETSPGQKVSAE